MSKPVTCLVVGAGSRGWVYSQYAVLYPDIMKVVGVAEPSQTRRQKLVDIGTIPAENIFNDWREAVRRERFADFVIVATTDQFHKEPAVAFARLGYHILLEKPMAVTPEDCQEIVTVSKECNVRLAVCHVLRYTPWVSKIKELIDAGRVGDVVNIRHTEPIAHWQFAHGYVRGNWRRESTSTFSLMAKSCHDVDLVNHWMAPRKCVRVSSFGHLTHFTQKNKPQNASTRCVDCSIETSCPYSAKKIYLGAFEKGIRGWPLTVLTDTVDIENVTEALRTGPYGKCVYDTDNDVMSQQVVNFQYDNGATATFNMVGFSKKFGTREVKVYGTKGEISFEEGWKDVQLFDFVTQETTYLNVQAENPGEMSGHGGADFYMMREFIDVLRGKREDIATGPEETLTSHLLVFAAEKARLENKVVNIRPDGSFS